MRESWALHTVTACATFIDAFMMILTFPPPPPLPSLFLFHLFHHPPLPFSNPSSSPPPPLSPSLALPLHLLPFSFARVCVLSHTSHLIIFEQYHSVTSRSGSHRHWCTYLCRMSLDWCQCKDDEHLLLIIRLNQIKLNWIKLNPIE